jgi:hypothetical protein
MGINDALTRDWPTGRPRRPCGDGGLAGRPCRSGGAGLQHERRDLCLRRSPGNQIAVSTAVALGGKGGGGGGNYVTFAVDQGGKITTSGQGSSGVLLQSIGGGGGAGGDSSALAATYDYGETVPEDASSLSVTATFSVGGSGGSGGPVNVQLFPTSAITTWGSNAIGVVAQSIGGGGGASQGGSYSFGGSEANVQPKVNIQVGTQGGSGNTGGPIMVNVQAPITTHGEDAQGVLAQSVGGGGGLGGSAGSDGSADNPVVEALDARQAASNIRSKSVAWDGTFTLAVGGTGGTGNSGGAVTVDLGSTIATSGDWASGIIAQSIGGGGGKGGTAAATGTGTLPQVTVNLNAAVGGTGGQTMGRSPDRCC